MDRLVIVTDPGHPRADVLIQSAVAALGRRDDIELAGVFVRRPDERRRSATPAPLDLERLTADQGGALLFAPGEDVNAEASLQMLRDLRAHVALSLFCVQKFGPAFLGLFEYAVNYHNGFLPAYRGLGATAWSIYRGESETGYTFHRIAAGLDTGPILCAGGILIPPNARPDDLERRKTLTAAQRMPELLQTIVDRAPGSEQRGEAGYYSSRRARALRVIPDPSILTAEDLLRRAHAFGRLILQIDGAWHRVDGLVEAPGWLSFPCADGIRLRPTRCKGWPLAWYRLLRVLGRRHGSPPREYREPGSTPPHRAPVGDRARGGGAE